MEKKFNKAEYDQEYSRLNYKHYHLKISKKRTDVLEYIDNMPNKNAYIADLIEKDMKKQKKGAK